MIKFLSAINTVAVWRNSHREQSLIPLLPKHTKKKGSVKLPCLPATDP